MPNTPQEKPKVTVLMCVFNGEQYIQASIQSILDQTFSDFELLILDDGSTDRSVEIIQGFSDPRIRFYQNPENMGLTYSRNRCLELAEGSYIAVQDADDIALSTRFAQQVALLDAEPDIGLVGTWLAFMDAQDKPIENYGTTTFKPVTDPGRLKWSLLFHCTICHCTVMYRKDLALAAGGYGNYPYGEDYDLFCRINTLARVKNIPQVLQQYRMSAASVTHTLSDEQKYQYNLEIMQGNLKRFLEELVPLQVIRYLRTYRLPYIDDPCIMEESAADWAAVAQESIALYIRLYQKFLAENALPLPVRQYIENDIICEISRHLFKLNRLSRFLFVVKSRKRLPPFLRTRHLLIVSLLNEPQFQLLVKAKQRLDEILRRAPQGAP
jgi:glycosyltransferase involved in cell wall biosynthesis